MTLFAEITTYTSDATEHTDLLEKMRGVDRDTPCALCAKVFQLGEAVIAYDCFKQPGLAVFHYHPACIEILIAVALQDMAKLVDEKGFVVGDYLASRRERVGRAFDTVMFAGTVQLPPDITR